MENEESLLLDCPSCNILITVNVSFCRDGTEFPCPICGDIICFQIEPDKIESVLAEARKKQEKELKRSFRLAFGDV